MEWYSATDLINVDGLPNTTQAINSQAKKKGWEHRPRAGKGGGKEYNISSLPIEVRAHLAAKNISQCSNTQAGKIAAQRMAITTATETRSHQTIAEDGLAQFAGLKGNALSRAEARLAVIELLDNFIVQAAYLPKTAAMAAFIAAYNDGSLEIDVHIRGQIEHVNQPTLYR